jgi:uncharacterized 2Fe-2S/4Fe-4S cluster protein (DUF4445 family)
MSSLIVEAGGAAHPLEITPSDEGVTLAEFLASRAFPLNMRCGGRGLCRGCEVSLVRGELSLNGKSIAAPAKLRACQVRLRGGMDAQVHLPDRVRLSMEPQVEESFRVDSPFSLSPVFACEAGKRDTVFAVDIGTTTVAVLLADLSSGRALSRAGAYNAQIRFGDNVLTRIGAAADPKTREALRRAILDETIVPLLLRACERAGRPLSRLAGGCMAGNTTMLYLLAGEDPSSLGVAPFSADFLEARRLSASALHLSASDGSGSIDPGLPVVLLPGISAYVGADLCAGMFATGMTGDAEPGLLVDIGTNGEIVLQSGGRLFATATAAGPAFEGAGLLSGTRAQAGALAHLAIAGDLSGFRLETIGGAEAERSSGLCGTAYIDFLAEGRRCGLLRPTGRFDLAAWKRLPSRYRTSSGASGLELVLAGPVRISEADIAQLLHAKAAIAAGIEILLLQAGLAASEIRTLYVAGGFGMHLDLTNALAIGMLPGFSPEQARVVGNSSLAGALLACLDSGALEEMGGYRGRTEIVDLNKDASFEDRFIDHLSLP